MRIQKKVHKRSKKVLFRKPESTFHVKEIKYVESYIGGPKVRTEIILAVDNYTSRHKSLNYG